MRRNDETAAHITGVRLVGADKLDETIKGGLRATAGQRARLLEMRIEEWTKARGIP
jgi:hypothetical protein